MTPRKASLRVAHQARCANASKSALESTGKGSGCTCSPSFYVMHRDRSEAVRKSPRVRNRAEAEKLLRQTQVEIDQGRIGTAPRKEVTLPQWIDGGYAEVLNARGVRGETRRTYEHTLRIARDAIGYVNLREIGGAELRRFYAEVQHTSEATRVKHLTQLGTCLQAAVDDGYAEMNPMRAFRRSLRLKAAKGTGYFTEGEVASILAKLSGAEAVYVAMVRVALATGMRAGELIALDWSDIDLTAGTVTVQHSYNPTDGLTLPKDGEARTLHLTAEARKAFEDWQTLNPVQTGGLVFPAPRSKTYVSRTYLSAIVRDAMTKAGLPATDEKGRRRKPLHSLRATFTRRMLEQGRHPMWVQAQLGHSSAELTQNVYGSWSEEAMLAEAAREAVGSGAAGSS